MTKTKKKQAGFSLIELMVVMLILMIIMGAIFQQLDMVQKRYRSEQNKLDLFQNAREFVDQFARDVHQAGFPNTKLFALNTLTSPRQQDPLNASGLFYIDSNTVRFEGDINGDGTVDNVGYYLVTTTSGNGNSRCPCLKRSQVPKPLGTDPIDVPLDPQTQVENVVTGTPIFTAFDQEGTEIDITGGLTRTNFSANTQDQIYKIYMIRIRLNVKANTAAGDIGTGFRPEVFISAGAQVNN